MSGKERDPSYRYQYEPTAGAPAAASADAYGVPAPRDVSTGPRNSFQPPRESFARPSIPNNAMIGGLNEPSDEHSKKGGFASRVMSLSIAATPENSDPRNPNCGSMVWPAGTAKSIGPKSDGGTHAHAAGNKGYQQALQNRMPLGKAAERRNDAQRKLRRFLCCLACLLFLIGYGSYAGAAAADLIAAGDKLANSQDVEVRQINVSGLCSGTLSVSAGLLLEWESFSSISVGDVRAAAQPTHAHASSSHRLVRLTAADSPPSASLCGWLTRPG